MKVKTPKYQYFLDSKNTVIAVSTYAGKIVKGRAKCDPRDTFDYETGKKIAAARCGEKIAKKRMKRAERELKKATEAVSKANTRYLQMSEYYKESAAAHKDAHMKVTELV